MGRIKQFGKGSVASKRVVETSTQTVGEEMDYDVLVCGGTLGIFLAAALAGRGFRVAVIERGRLCGRDQEWNISRKELQVLVDLELITDAELEDAIVTEYNPARVSFKDMQPLEVQDILNCGVSPKKLLACARSRFEGPELNGTVLEGHGFEKATVCADMVQVSVQIQETGSGSLGAGGDGKEGARTIQSKVLKTRLLVDAMGNFSPIVRQLRAKDVPDGVCVVVGSCARADWPTNDRGDLLYSFTPIEDKLQYFWEAFPSDSKDSTSPLRTTYMFSYLDADMRRPSLPEFYDSYLEWLPKYQGVSTQTMEPIRALFGAFPTYRESPLKTNLDRILLFGDSSGVQSPLSFGGLGAMLRHLTRIVDAVDDALECDELGKDSLGLITPYMPSLSVTWLFQRAMSVGADQKVRDPDLINKVLGSNFTAMQRMGDDVLRPFLQDVVKFKGLTQAMVGMMVSNPLLVLKVMQHVGPVPVADWMKHYVALGAYDFAYRISSLLPNPNHDGRTTSREYYWKRVRDSIKYGSGQDHT
eukprot:Plantae.Rhodophyta-Purpureofilum_apyrenoidigerum.ctg27932.p1 GENE.Plantae.Rhodophyta-Purpureofilum_apyrenoidigerum.ctg27932~~Plantae.Rhodophyta-Purpureofilum_apyrenoidigerum.ctg27932.p1  ORF type:complete len:529 (-),score=86.04 Plantae.Rhodophyta-Purpureofilum_apyrenoidigerum.ctg27932:107-1693(-)